MEGKVLRGNEHTLHLESRVRVLSFDQRPRQQSRAHQQNGRGRHLTRHERPAKARTPGHVTNAHPVTPQHHHGIHPRSPQRRPQRARDPAGQRHTEGKTEHCQVECQIQICGRISRRVDPRHEGRCQTERHQKPQKAASHREHHAFR